MGQKKYSLQQLSSITGTNAQSATILRSSPSWISQQYTKQTNDDFTNLQQFVMRKNDQGLIGLYDIYKKNTVSTGTANFSAASDTTTTAYSMYLISVKPQ